MVATHTLACDFPLLDCSLVMGCVAKAVVLTHEHGDHSFGS